MKLLPLILLLSACNSFSPTDAVQITPPVSYRGIWEKAEACTGLRGDYAKLHFYLMPDVFDTPNGRSVGYYDHHGNIYLAAGYADLEMVVKHEMIHALGVHNHPRIPFETPCHATWQTWEEG